MRVHYRFAECVYILDVKKKINDFGTISSLFTTRLCCEGKSDRNFTRSITVKLYVKKLLHCRQLMHYAEEHEKANQNPTEYLSNPINAYLLVKRLTSDWKSTEELLQDDLHKGWTFFKTVQLFDVAFVYEPFFVSRRSCKELDQTQRRCEVSNGRRSEWCCDCVDTITRYVQSGYNVISQRRTKWYQVQHPIIVYVCIY